MTRKVIALSGWKGSGKDTVADYLISEYGFQRISFAAPLKDMVSQLYKVPREYMDSPTHKEMPLMNMPVNASDLTGQRMHDLFRSELSSGYWTPRALCILEGSVKRAVNPSYWVINAVEHMVQNPTTNYVITDLRFQSEMGTIATVFPQVELIRINRFQSIGTQDPSERDMDEYKAEHYIQNHGTKEELYAQVDSIMFGISSTF